LSVRKRPRVEKRGGSMRRLIAGAAAMSIVVDG
jgi:hypothetical protein